MERRSDGKGLDALPRTVDQVEEQVRDEDRGEDRGQEADDESDGEALDGPGAELEEEKGGHDRRHVGVDDRAPRALEAEVDGGLWRLAVVHLLADALEDEDVRIDGHADRQDEARDAGQRERRVDVGHRAEEDERVEDERQNRVRAREPVIENHREKDANHADDRGEDAFLDGVEAERRPHGAFLENDHLGRKRARTEHEREGVCLLRGEVPLDDAAILDLAVDVRRGLDALVEHDREALVDVLARDLPELQGSLGIQKEHDGGLVELVAVDARVLHVAARDGGGALEHVPDRRARAGVGVFVEALDDLEVLGHRAAVGGSGSLHRRERTAAVIHELELEEARRPYDLLDAARIAHAGDRAHDAVGALPLDDGLGDAESVDAIADRLDGLARRLVLYRDPLGVLEGDLPFAPALVDGPRIRRKNRRDEILELRGVRLLVDREREARAVRGTGGDHGHAALAAFVFEPLERVLSLDAQRIGRLHLHDEVDAAAKGHPPPEAVPEDVRDRRVGRSRRRLLQRLVAPPPVRTDRTEKDGQRHADAPSGGLVHERNLRARARPEGGEEPPVRQGDRGMRPASPGEPAESSRTLTPQPGKCRGHGREEYGASETRVSLSTTSGGSAARSRSCRQA